MQETKKAILEADEYGDAQVIAHKLDISQEDQVQQVVEAVVSEFGRIDYAVNAAVRTLCLSMMNELENLIEDREF